MSRLSEELRGRCKVFASQVIRLSIALPRQREEVRVPGKQLLVEVWGPAYETETHYLRVYMAQLRRKLEPDPARPRYLITEPGVGYRFQG